MVLSQISNKVHRFQQITKQRKVNVQRKANGKNNYDILIFLDIYVFCIHICIIIIIIIFADYKYPMFCIQTILYTNKVYHGMVILSHNFEPMYDKLSNLWLTVLARGIVKYE